MVSWRVLYLAKSCRPDVNNGLGGDPNGGHILAPRRLFKFDSNNGPSPGHFNLVSDRVTSVQAGFPVGAILAKGCRLDLNNGLGSGSNSGSILPPPPPPQGVYLSPTRIMAPPQAISILNCKHEVAQKLF